MMIDEILHSQFPGEPGITYWHTKVDGTPWEDPYDGLIWEHPSLPKPTKEDLERFAVEAESKILKEAHNKDIYNKLVDLDLKSIRALRAKDTVFLDVLENQAKALRAELEK